MEEIIEATNAMIEQHGEDDVTATFLLEDGRLVPRGPHRIPSALVHQVVRSQDHDTPYARSLTGEDIVVVTDVTDDPSLAASREALIESGFKALWSLPIRHRGNGRQWGAIVTFCRDHRPRRLRSAAPQTWPPTSSRSRSNGSTQRAA